MITLWLLIVIVRGDGTGVSSAEFTSQQRCEYAAAEIRKQSGITLGVNVLCVPK